MTASSPAIGLESLAHLVSSSVYPRSSRDTRKSVMSKRCRHTPQRRQDVDSRIALDFLLSVSTCERFYVVLFGRVTVSFHGRKTLAYPTHAGQRTAY